MATSDNTVCSVLSKALAASLALCLWKLQEQILVNISSLVLAIRQHLSKMVKPPL